VFREHEPVGSNPAIPTCRRGEPPRREEHKADTALVIEIRLFLGVLVCFVLLLFRSVGWSGVVTVNMAI
jgi:hypothetical protein